MVAPGEQEPIDEEVKDIVHRIAQLNLLQVADLTDALKEVFKYQEPDFSQGVVMGSAAEDEEGMSRYCGNMFFNAYHVYSTAAQEKTEFDVKLVSFDSSSKIKLIKEVRALTGLGLQEVFCMSENANLPQYLLSFFRQRRP